MRCLPTGISPGRSINKKGEHTMARQSQATHEIAMQPHLRGHALLDSPTLNKGTAFTLEERRTYGLEGLLPHTVETLDRQLERVLQHLDAKTTDLERYIYLIGLADRNETLFYRTAMSDPARFLPILYDPTVAEACLKFGHIFRRPRGLYLSLQHKGRVKEVLRNWPEQDVRVICLTSGGRILGLGDLGANGMGIPIGKLQLYTACAAVPPRYLLPVHVDCGTTNQALINDPLYLGLRQPRVSADELDEFVDEVVAAVQDVFPDCCLHFEDWAGVDAVRLLARYRDRVCCYNDDIQGTAGVVLAGLINGLKITGGILKEQRILFLGAGSAAIGLANLIVAAMGQQGVVPKFARQQIRMFDTKGLVVAGRPGLAAHKLPYAQELPPSKPFKHLDLASECPRIVEAVEDFKPTILIGVSTVGKLFSRAVVEAMSRHNARPIIFALSNPISKHECLPDEAYAWSGGTAVYAGGVQFAPVHLGGKTYIPSQANNLYIFPAVGLAVYATKAKRVTDEMFIEAAQATADQVTPEQLKLGMLFPPQSNILETEVTTATRVAEFTFEKGLAQVERPRDIRTWIEGQLYTPRY